MYVCIHFFVFYFLPLEGKFSGSRKLVCFIPYAVSVTIIIPSHVIAQGDDKSMNELYTEEIFT